MFILRTPYTLQFLLRYWYVIVDCANQCQNFKAHKALRVLAVLLQFFTQSKGGKCQVKMSFSGYFYIVFSLRTCTNYSHKPRKISNTFGIATLWYGSVQLKCPINVTFLLGWTEPFNNCSKKLVACMGPIYRDYIRS